MNSSYGDHWFYLDGLSSFSWLVNNVTVHHIINAEIASSNIYKQINYGHIGMENMLIELFTEIKRNGL